MLTKPESAERLRARRSSSLLSAETIHSLHVHGVEALADAEQEDTDDDKGDQHREGDTNLDHQRHPLGPGRREHQAVLERHEADHLANSVTPSHHHQQTEQHHRQRKGQILARQRIRVRGHPQHHHHR